MIVRINRFQRVVYLGLFFCIVAFRAAAAEQKFAELGDFKLESGGVIKGCRIGYRTFGSINADKSNVVVYLMWAGGKTEQLHFKAIDGGKLIDTNKYYVIAIDPLSNGVSSSPSNSRAQPRMKFPEYTMRDLVNAEYTLLTNKLGIRSVLGITGASMGGMQSFQWMISYPDFAEKILPIVGSPQLAAYDLVHWQMQLDAIINDRRWNNGNYTEMPALSAEYEFGAVLLTTPENYNNKMTRADAFEALMKAQTNTTFDACNKVRQVQAMMSIDITEKFGGSWEKAAATVKADVFAIVAKQDHVVTPAPALKFAKMLSAKTLILEGDCGHSAPSCESDKVNAAAAAFLDGRAQQF
ncbi:MAG: alpha/beta fold hydrolase [Acidobacteriota bacterium]